ncbi:general secretion pathway protein A [Janthinobacterium sp. CG_23.3]|uniref:XrtA/PEP-CTERM system-associated ATPase n=1 Tax=unclassified Janthinobacterium TaxID=2610881 RepID=UPI0003476ABE|nr:XrtA/PEP-CTERM system-associated ATPase [Janthinobacterium sp. CG3]
MYEQFYGFTGKPFQTNPDPAFYFGSLQHRRAMDYLVYGMHRNEGFIVITGEVGAGKTTLVRNVFGKLDPEKYLCAHLVSTQLGADDALRLVGTAFGLPVVRASKAELLIALEAFFGSAYRAGKRCMLVVDEAQNLSMQAVEELRMLSNFQLNTHALLQSFLIGQPEFRHTLQSAQMTQLRQRVIAACHIGPLDGAETRRYIEHRLRHVGWDNAPLFAEQAFAAIHAASAGIPRRINALCDRLLLMGFLANSRAIGGDDVLELASEMAAETAAPARPDAAGPAPPERQGGPGQQGAAAAPAELEARMARLEAALDGLSRNNASALSLLGRLVAAIQQAAGDDAQRP